MEGIGPISKRLIRWESDSSYGCQMLEIVEQYLQALGTARSDSEITDVLGEAVSSFGFRSGYLIEYGSSLSTAAHVLDTNAKRQKWWNEYFASDYRPALPDVAAALNNGPLIYLDRSRFRPGSDRFQTACQLYDVVDMTAIPISFEGNLVGVAGFSGVVKLDRLQETALTLIAYSAFAQLRAARKARADYSGVVLTPREREVIRLSADGLTSSEIAEALGMSARTANQHVDNVADKLGTRNRAHTVAESVRRGLL